MPPNPRLAAALEELRALQADGMRVFASSQLKRNTREVLIKHGFLQEVMKGWLISSSSATRAGDTTPWFASYWEFCRRYCEARFGDSWHVSPEQSLLLHAENSTVPSQIVICSPRANNDRVDLPHRTSFFMLQVKAMPPPNELELRDGIRVFTRDAALIKVTPSFFSHHPVDARIVLSTIADPSGVIAHLLEGRQSVIGGRLVGALKHIGRTNIADEILAATKAADISVRVSDPFDADEVSEVKGRARPLPAIVARLQQLWARSREAVLAHAPSQPRTKPKQTAYVHQIDDIYTLDAYHSLSIEGYQVTAELIERVASGAWSPDTNATDLETVNALAARGYWLAFQRVRDVAVEIHRSHDITPIRISYRDWYRELFAPHVAAGVLDAKLLAGHRAGSVFLRGSRHVPPRWDIVGEAMSALFDLIEAEPSAFVRAVLAHWLVGYIHPFPDGNGRIARFVMNALLADGTYPWTVIRVEDRTAYLAALEKASVENDVGPFAAFIAAQVAASLKRPTPTRRRRIRR